MCVITTNIRIMIMIRIILIKCFLTNIAIRIFKKTKEKFQSCSKFTAKSQ